MGRRRGLPIASTGKARDLRSRTLPARPIRLRPPVSRGETDDRMSSSRSLPHRHPHSSVRLWRRERVCVSNKNKARANAPGFDAAPNSTQAYATFLNASLRPLLIGSAVSFAAFWASAANSLPCSPSASNRVRICAAETSTASVSEVALASAQSKAALSLVRPASSAAQILRGTMKKIADHDPWTLPAAIDDPAILDEIGAALKQHGVG